MAVSISILIIVSAFAVDMGLAHAQRVRVADALQEAEAKCLQPYYATIVKNSNAPARDMCRLLAQAVREQGYDGEIWTYYYEPPRADSGLAEDKRVYVFGARVGNVSQTVFARALGTESLEQSAIMWAQAKTYASVKTYEPALAVNGYMHVAAGQAASMGSFTQVSGLDESAMPGVSKAVEKAIADANAADGVNQG